MDKDVLKKKLCVPGTAFLLIKIRCQNRLGKLFKPAKRSSRAIPVKVFIDKKAQLSILGTEMDYQAVLRIRIRIHRFHVFLGLLDPDLDPSIIK
jgi:hypothetical protein